MAEIRPFRGWRYNSELNHSIQDLTFPLQAEKLHELSKNKFNAIHLACPATAEQAAETLKDWKQHKILLQDPLPSIYTYSISFNDENGKKENLNGFICNIKLHAWSDQVILRHENVLPGSVDNLVNMLKSTQLHITPSHGLYTDPEFKLEPILEKSLLQPIYHFNDQTGITHKMGIVQDWKLIRYFAEVLSSKSIILADGHHRYSASLEYIQEYSNKDSFSANWHCIFLSNSEKNSFRINPIHRLVQSLKTMSEEAIIEKLKDYFWVELIDNPYRIEKALSERGKYCFGIVFQKQYMIITLKDGLEKMISWDFPEVIKGLDLTVLHYFIIEKCLDIKGKDQKNSKNINFSFNFTKVIMSVLEEKEPMAIITRPVSMNEIKKVCYSGFTLPHKSTWFFPKILCGLVFGSIDEKEFAIECELYKNFN